MNIVIDNAIPYLHGVFEPWAVVRYCDTIVRGDLVEADVVVVRTRTRCDEALLADTRVRVVATATAGTDHIDMNYCRRAGIVVVSAPGSNSRGVLQWVAAALAGCRQSPSGLVLGVVGVGHVGTLVAEHVREWGFEVLCCDPPRARARRGSGDFVDLSELAARCDIITFHTPLTFEGDDATYHLADDDFFAKTRPGGLILNSARGEVIDHRAAMRSACDFCIDTWEDEPHIDRDFLNRALLATPHIAGYSVQGKANASAAVARGIAREFGLPLDDWYPAGVEPTTPHHISWEELRRTITAYFDITAQTYALKSAPGKFEEFRKNYRFREEYF